MSGGLPTKFSEWIGKNEEIVRTKSFYTIGGQWAVVLGEDTVTGSHCNLLDSDGKQIRRTQAGLGMNERMSERRVPPTVIYGSFITVL